MSAAGRDVAKKKTKKKKTKFENSESKFAAVLERGSVNIQFVPP